MRCSAQEAMLTNQEKAQCVLWYHETRSSTTVQRHFQTIFGRNPPDVKSIKAWYEKFKNTGSVADLPRSGRPRTSADRVEAVRQSFLRSPKKSVCRASRELQIPKSSLHDILHKHLLFHANKVQIIQALSLNDSTRRYDFAVEMLSRIEDDDGYLRRIAFSDEATFFVSGVVNHHNVRIWRSQPPGKVMECTKGSSKVNVWCVLLHDRIIGPFFFAETTITSAVYLDMLQLYAAPQLLQYPPDVLFQQDSALSHWGLDVRAYLDMTFPGRWIGCDGPIIESIPPVMLANVWTETEYRLDVLRATKGAHVEVY
ncbi:hypothetical protein X975_03155, partial [Stegodyphus mimosarum]